jgi:hypothetical protein
VAFRTELREVILELKVEPGVYVSEQYQPDHRSERVSQLRNWAKFRGARLSPSRSKLTDFSSLSSGSAFPSSFPVLSVTKGHSRLLLHGAIFNPAAFRASLRRRAEPRCDQGPRWP